MSMDGAMSEQVVLLKSMGFAHMQDEAIAVVLQQNNNDLEQTLDQLFAMQFEVSEQSAEVVAAMDATSSAHNNSATGNTSASLSDRPMPLAEGGGEAAEGGEQLVDALVGLLLDQPRAGQRESDRPGGLAGAESAGLGGPLGAEPDVRQFDSAPNAIGTSSVLTCQDLENALLSTALPSAQTRALPHQTFVPPIPATRLSVSAPDFSPQADDGFQAVSRQKPPARGGARRRGDEELTQPDLVRLVVFVGLPGSGKSTLAERFRTQGGWAIVCQDELGNRPRCEEEVYRKLSQGFRVVVDRTNMDRTQRSHWTRIARELRLPIQAVAAVHLDVPMETCKQRVMSRTSHKTLPPTRESLGIIERFRTTFEPPRVDEGFCAVLRVSPSKPCPALDTLATAA